MIRDITLGQYYGCTSCIHRLDPRLKIIGTLLYLASLFVAKGFVGIAACAGFLAVAIALSKVPPRFILRGMKPILLLLLFTFCLNMFMVDGRILWQWGFLKITEEGLYRAIFMGLRLILLIMGSSLLTLTTTPISLTDGLERLLRPLARVGVPAHELAMMMSIALRFIPTLLEETDKIMKAQQARGADFESGNLVRRAKSLIPILVPLFVSAFRIAQELAMAMEARCYRGGKGRTRMHQMRFSGGDAAAMLVLAVYFGGIIMERVLG